MAFADFPEYRDCRLCPRECGTDRAAGGRGFCRETDRVRVSSFVAHFGEEPPISGMRGSGTIFFSGCSMGCFFCQNHQISRGSLGEFLDFKMLCDRARTLVDQGVHNLNYVTPDHFWPHIRGIIGVLRDQCVSIPHLINGSGYHAAAVIREMTGFADIFLPDFKFADPELARCCAGRSDYPEVALAAIETMVNAKGLLDSWIEEDGSCRPATRGVLVRHLILPGAAENSIRALTLLRERFGRYLPLSLMSQYRPTPRCEGRGPFDRPITADEYRCVHDAAEDLGFENIFIQPPAMNDDFSPDFNKKDPFLGNRKAR